MQSVYEETYWREKWPWLPLINDCHGAVRSGVEDAGFEYPEGPFRVSPGGDDDTNDDGGNRPYYRVYELMP
jgi:hypothetical protein